MLWSEDIFVDLLRDEHALQMDTTFWFITDLYVGVEGAIDKTLSTMTSAEYIGNIYKYKINTVEVWNFEAGPGNAAIALCT